MTKRAARAEGHLREDLSGPVSRLRQVRRAETACQGPPAGWPKAALPDGSRANDKC